MVSSSAPPLNVGGLTFTGLTLYATHVKTSPSRKAASAETVLSRVA